MFFLSFSFPLEEKSNVIELETRIKRINRFFTKKAVLNGKSRAFGIQLLQRCSKDSPELSNYYLFFKFFNVLKERQKKLEIIYSIGNDKSLYEKLWLDVYYLSFIASLPLCSVSFSHDGKNLNVGIELSDEYVPIAKNYLNMLLKKKEKREEI